MDEQVINRQLGLYKGMLGDTRTEAALTPERLSYLRSSMGLDYGNETEGPEIWGEAPKSDWTSYRTLPEAVGEFAGLQAERAIGPMVRAGDVLRGRNPYGSVDEINTPSVVREAMVADAMGAVGTVATPGMAFSKPSATVFPTFGGLGARNAPRKMQEIAEKALAAGRDPDEVRRYTGWFKGMEGKPRFEIDDSAMKLTPYAKNMFAKEVGMEGTYRVGANIGKDEVFRLNQVIDHPSLFDNYPELKNTMVLFDKRGGGASFDPYMNEIHLPRKGVMLGQQNSYLDSISHEIQHWIQQKEGFARGGSPENFYPIKGAKIGEKVSGPLEDAAALEAEKNRLLGIFKNAKQSGQEYLLKQFGVDKQLREIEERIALLQPENRFNRYQNLAGEIEARDVSGRRTWDADMRSAVPPDLRRDAIIRMGEGGKAASVESNILKAYNTLRAKEGYSNLPIAQIRDMAGVSQAEIEAFIKKLAEEGKVTLSRGDWSLSNEHIRSGMIPMGMDPGLKEPYKYTLVKFKD